MFRSTHNSSWLAIARPVALIVIALFLVLTISDTPRVSATSIETPVEGNFTFGPVGKYSSLALDSSGIPVISYFHCLLTETLQCQDGRLMVMTCDDANCAGIGSLFLFGSTGVSGAWTSITLDALGYPVVSYIDGAFSGDLKILHCGNATCSTGNSIVTVQSGDFYRTSLALDALGYPVVSYIDGSTLDLKLLHCGNANCTSGNSVTTPDSTNDVGDYSSLQLDSAGYPVISYYDQTSADLKIMHCNDANCAGNDESIESPDTGGSRTSLVLDASGYPVVSYVGGMNGDVMLMHCNDPDCAGGDESIEVATPFGASGTSLALSPSGFPVVAYRASFVGLGITYCGDSDCSTSTATTIDSGGSGSPSLKLDGLGFPVVSYHYREGFARDLRVFHGTQLVDITGKWNLTLAGDAADTCSFTFTQSGTALTATVSCTVSGTGSLSGTIELNKGAFSVSGTVGIVSFSVMGTTDGLTMSGTWSTTTPTAGTFTGFTKKQAKPGDTDGDGCSDQAENGSDETLGGLRNYLDPNDYYDVLGPGGSLTLDGVIDLPNDILGVIQHFSPQGQPPYEVRFDRGVTIGANHWERDAPDGVIDLPNDILGVIQQFGHNCV